jgi:hypothetical protein
LNQKLKIINKLKKIKETSNFNLEIKSFPYTFEEFNKELHNYKINNINDLDNIKFDKM